MNLDATVTSFLNSVLLENDQAQKNRETFFESCYLSQIRDLRTSFLNSFKILATENIGNPIQTVFTSPKIGEQLKIQERKPPSFAVNALYINLNVFCVIQIISAILIVISISKLKNTEPPPLVHT